MKWKTIRNDKNFWYYRFLSFSFNSFIISSCVCSMFNEKERWSEFGWSFWNTTCRPVICEWFRRICSLTYSCYSFVWQVLFSPQWNRRNSRNFSSSAYESNSVIFPIAVFYSHCESGSKNNLSTKTHGFSQFSQRNWPREQQNCTQMKSITIGCVRKDFNPNVTNSYYYDY